jgi:hypothetical protein
MVDSYNYMLYRQKQPVFWTIHAPDIVTDRHLRITQWTIFLPFLIFEIALA